MEVKKIDGSQITFPYYPHNKKCVYCEGDYPVDATRFEVTLKNGFKIKPICDVCLRENVLDHPHEVDIIINLERD